MVALSNALVPQNTKLVQCSGFLVRVIVVEGAEVHLSSDLNDFATAFRCLEADVLLPHCICHSNHFVVYSSAAVVIVDQPPHGEERE